jgi:hypothetical protein
MDRQGWMLVRAYAPAGILFVFALLVMQPIGGLRDSAIGAGFFTAFRCVPVAMTGWALLLASTASYRLWRWERGDGPHCVFCGGPLGHERDGKASRGGAYRKCYACGKYVNHRHYE